MPVDRDQKNPEDPSTTSFAWDEMAPKWSMITALMGGTEAMRARGMEFLPRHPNEDGSNYEERLAVSTLFNMFELTLEALVGKPFSDPVKLNDDVPQEINDIEDDIDLQGNDITTFSRNWFREGLAKAFAHVLVDFPTITEEERVDRTLEDDRRDGRRPYWVFIKPENLIFASSQIMNGREVLTHVRIREEVVVREGFAENIISQIRVLEPGRFEVWQFVRQNKRRKGEWRKVEEGTTGVPFIPLVTFYANRQALMVGKPPLEDLGYLNVRHWQSTSDQINVLTVARFPMLAASGVVDQTGNTITIGPRQLLGSKDPNGRYYYVEHSGKAIGAGRQDLIDLEQQMASYGAQFLKRVPGSMTATARALDTAESTSPLQDMAVRFVDALETVLDMTALWFGLQDGGTVDLRTDFSANEPDPEQLRTLLEARKGRDISREDFLEQLKELQILSDDFDPRRNLMRLMMEVSALGIDPSLVDPNDIMPQEQDDDDDDEDDEDEDEET